MLFFGVFGMEGKRKIYISFESLIGNNRELKNKV